MSEVLIQDTSFSARDGYTLGATVFTPADAPRGAVLINSATAVPRKIYRGFASHLASQGFAVVTYGLTVKPTSCACRPPSRRS